jgi:hypothetical protein
MTLVRPQHFMALPGSWDGREWEDSFIFPLGREWSVTVRGVAFCFLPLKGEVPGGFAEGGGGFLRSAPTRSPMRNTMLICGPKVETPTVKGPKRPSPTTPTGGGKKCVRAQ